MAVWWGEPPFLSFWVSVERHHLSSCPTSDVSQAVQPSGDGGGWGGWGAGPGISECGGKGPPQHSCWGFEPGAGRATLLNCKRYLLACGLREGKLVIVAINQVQTEEKLSDFGELFCTEEVEKCSCGVRAGLAGYWQRWDSRGHHGVEGGPLLQKAIAAALTCRMTRERGLSSWELSWGTTVNKLSLSLALLFSSLWICVLARPLIALCPLARCLKGNDYKYLVPAMCQLLELASAGV